MSKKMWHDLPVLYGFERSSCAVSVRTLSARIDKGSVFSKAKVVLTNFRPARQFNRILFNSGFFAPIDAALPALSVSLPCGAAGKKTAIAGVKPAPLQRIYSFGLVALNTRNATSAASNGYNGNSATLGYTKERRGGVIALTIANKQSKLVKVSITAVCGN